MQDYYDLETFDFHVRKGDTINLSFVLKDKDNAAKDISSFGCNFNLYNSFDNKTEDNVAKTHNDSETGGDGVYYFGDTQKWTELNLTANNQIVVNFKSDDIESLEKTIYPFYLILKKTVNGIDTRKTIVNGNLIVSDDHGDNETFRTVIVDLSAFEN